VTGPTSPLRSHMSRCRRTCRSALRPAFRHANRAALRVRWRAPDDLRTALAFYRRAISAHRRLARLAPCFFDSAVVDRQRRDQEARRRWMDLWKPAFIKVYGTEPAPVPDELPPLPHPRTQAAVERQLACCNLYLAAASEALQRFQLRHPHAVLELNRLIRLIEIASDLARLATGSDSTQPQVEPVSYENALADLERIYGDPRADPRVGECNEPLKH